MYINDIALTDVISDARLHDKSADGRRGVGWWHARLSAGADVDAAVDKNADTVDYGNVNRQRVG